MIETRHLKNAVIFFQTKEKDLHFTGMDNQKMCLKNIVNRYLKEKHFDVIEKESDFNKSIRNLATIDAKIKTILNPNKYEYESK